MVEEIKDTGIQHSPEQSPALAKFGDSIKGGFQIVPDILLKSQGELGITNVEMVVLLNILMHWWTAEKNPFPRASTISKRMKASQRTVQRAILALEEKKLIARINEKGTTYIDPSLLVEKLNRLVKADTHYQHRIGLVNASEVFGATTKA